MKKYFLLLLLFSLSNNFLGAQDAREIVRKADEHAKGNSSIANITIQTVRPTWNREMTVKSWTKGNDMALILVTAPVKDKGIVYLKQKKEVWNWIPAIERTIKLPPSMMSQSWMGTDFTNDDFVKEASVVEDYNHTIVGDTTVEGRLCHKILMIPKPAAAIIWGKVIICIDKKDFMMMHVEYFDEENILVNTLHCSDVKMLGGRLLPARMEMTPAEKPGCKTIMIYNSLVFDSTIEDSFFTTQNMPKVQ